MDSDSNNDGKKRCKCKKSKCLKLYCECFAAGWYCDKNCSCQDCFNSPDYEDTVEETRELIKTRNPVAFSSKISSHPVESPPVQNVENQVKPLKPVAGTHRRGCNCKKSMCQKKYCECFQANVGCCNECRCSGCQNKFGNRAAFNIFNVPIHETVQNEMQSTVSRFPQHEFNNNHALNPTTPFQHSGYSHENDPSTTGSFDMVSLYQQAYLNAFMNQFTPPDTTHFNARNLNSVMNIPPMMDLSNGSTSSGSYFSAITWPGPLMSPVNVFVGPEAMNSNEKPNRPNTGAQLDFTRY